MKGNLIILESEGDLSDNAYALYYYMKHNEYLNKYKVVWLVDHIENYTNEKNVYYFNNKNQTQEFIESNWKKGDTILFKASNGMKFFDMVANLEKV